MAWSDAARAAAAEARRRHARGVDVGKGIMAPRTAFAKMVRAERNKNVMNSSIVSAHGSASAAFKARNSDARARARGALRVEGMYGSAWAKSVNKMMSRQRGGVKLR